MNILSITSVLSLVFFISFNSCTTESTAKQQQADQAQETPSPSKMYESLDAIGFLNKMSEKNVVVIDIRSPFETKKGKIEKAIEIELMPNSFNKAIAKLDKSKTYLICSATGNRGVTACRRMFDMNFHHLYNLDGGYQAWKRVILKEVTPTK